jgi:cAMP-dependent protein kinase regulator
VFGEVALLYDAVRTATITCTTDVEVWQLDGNIFKKIIIENSQQRRSTELGFIQRVDLFRNLDKYEKLKLLDGLKVQWFKKGDAIIRAGEQG